MKKIVLVLIAMCLFSNIACFGLYDDGDKYDDEGEWSEMGPDVPAPVSGSELSEKQSNDETEIENDLLPDYPEN
ncbi:hypothetical protein ACFL3J_02830 [Candidatus Omnitrophota bacterium]